MISIPSVRPARRILPVLAALAALSACGAEVNVIGPEPQVIEETDFAPSLGVDLEAMTVTESGLYYQDFEVGEGPMPTSGDTIRVAYTGYLSDGRQFDTGELFYVVDELNLIEGWEQGISTMAEGGVRKLVIPPALGYGPTGNGPIPGGAILVFDLTLLELGPVQP